MRTLYPCRVRIGYLWGCSVRHPLTRRLHKSFDRYEWALYPLGDGNFVVHYFHPSSDCDVAYHGKVISRSHFRGFKGKLPGEVYVHWHYRQCVLMNLRGIAVREVYVWTTVLVFYPPCLVFGKLTAFYYVPCERIVVGTTTLPSGTGDDSELYDDVET
ncbi:BZ3500_MvSof-1268-A1-R1_Chr5-3g08321 [Microbotryum saponariae]|uniref:BZ3500_MvSof-1268-A1-R1_Chr5-3g08321 protein n=1 Tax=Microbotryum saponariae TaxID=289078 RepID=A0A2X0KHH7_9BASI|nr:BZ3500_MvSof-1268-A1-R1_Chr5-3g08321 [Microbotryum saponariae]SDA08429.1 BZ3501_MvSof-1269-A2-R1_Chr5-3g08049 [Microbotryum saponariae]